MQEFFGCSKNEHSQPGKIVQRVRQLTVEIKDPNLNHRINIRLGQSRVHF